MTWCPPFHAFLERTGDGENVAEPLGVGDSQAARWLALKPSELGVHDAGDPAWEAENSFGR
jgi:hypothetical protein